MERREFLKALAASGAAAAVPSLFLTACGSGAAGSDGTLRIIQTASVASLDPIWTTAPGTRDLSFLVYDQLVAMDADFRPQPQMAAGWTVEDAGRAYLFRLRDGLKFHDGSPVRPQDCIASIRRWAARDGFGGVMLQHVAAMTPVDERSFRIALDRPFPLLPLAIGKSSAPSCLIMPERLARTSPSEQVTEAIGSGPYRLLKEEWVPGSRTVLARFDDYVPRSEPTSGLAGSRKAGAPRLELTQIGDGSTAMAALVAGEQDYWDMPPADLLAGLAADPNIMIGSRYVLPVNYMLQFNHRQPPFDRVEVRRALAMGLDQREMLRTAVADPKLIRACYSFFACDTPYGVEDGAEVLRTADVAQAAAALAAAGYRNQKVVLLASAEGIYASIAPVVEDRLRKIGFEVELVPLDFASMAQRRTNDGPVAEGGWSLFLTGWLGTDILDPGVHPMLRGAGKAGYAGWCDDPRIEALRSAWMTAPTDADRTRIARDLQLQACRTLPYVPIGAMPSNAAYRKTVRNVFRAPAAAYYNLGKTA